MVRIDGVVSFLTDLADWQRYVLALLLGVALAGAQAPLSFWPLAFIALTVLLVLQAPLRGWHSFFTGFAFAYGYFVAGLYWIGIAFFVDAEKYALLLPLPVLGLPLLLALFPAAGLWLAQYAAGRSASRYLLLAPFGWLVGEYLRGHVLTGFPWNQVGAIWGEWPATMQLAAYIGVEGLGLITMLAVSGFALALTLLSSRLRLVALVLPLLFAVGLGLGSLRLPTTHVPSVPDVQLRLVQPSVPQTVKWRDDLRQQHLQEHVALSLKPAPNPPTHIIWPETALPYLLDEEPRLREGLARLLPSKAGALITGAPRRDPTASRPVVFNSVFGLNASGDIAGVYDKLHLVPFGEYLPFRSLLKPLGLDALAASGVDFSPGQQSAPVGFPGLPPARVLICYEAIFADEISDGSAAPRAGLLLNVTNDSWFGISSGPYQHLVAARFRAVEQGLPLIRAANNGISAIVDPYGRILASLGLDEIGTVDGALPQALPDNPPYTRIGDIPLLAFSLILLICCFVASRRSTKH